MSLRAKKCAEMGGKKRGGKRWKEQRETERMKRREEEERKIRNGKACKGEEGKG